MSKTRSSKSKNSPNRVFQFRITLWGSDPPIWRSFAVHGSIALPELHDIIQIVMGWEDDHLHKFIFPKGRVRSGNPQAIRRLDGNRLEEQDVPIGQILRRKGTEFHYEYDFGDSWLHVLVVEEISEPREGIEYPVCLAGERSCPPEDCGGVWGYEAMLQAIADPNHPYHEDRAEWLGEDFDPEAFELDEINRRLRWRWGTRPTREE